MADLEGLIADLAAEQADLDARVAELPAEAWAAPTPAAGWAIRDAISHLWFFDCSASLALTDRAAFDAHIEALNAGLAAAKGHPDGTTPDVERSRSVAPAQLLADWRDGRSTLLAAARGAAESDPKGRVPWYGLEMSVASFTTARLMETWAHGQDVSDALGLAPIATERLRHVCHIGVGARAYAFRANGQTDSGDPIRIEVVSPAGQLWTWGPPDATDRVTGPALDLALLVTQRRHRADTALAVVGPTAQAWAAIAQSFAGPAGPGRAPLPVEPVKAGTE